jgi:hypothetical protein
LASIYGSTRLRGTGIWSLRGKGDVRPQTVMGVAGPHRHLAGPNAFAQPGTIAAFAAEQHREAPG